MVVGKLQLNSVTSFPYTPGKKINFQAIYDPSIPEDKRFMEASPSGSLEFFVNNPAAIVEMEKPGARFVVLMSPEEYAAFSAPPPSEAPAEETAAPASAESQEKEPE